MEKEVNNAKNLEMIRDGRAYDIMHGNLAICNAFGMIVLEFFLVGSE